MRKLELKFRKEGKTQKYRYSVGHRNHVRVWIAMVKNVKRKTYKKENKNT